MIRLDSVFHFAYSRSVTQYFILEIRRTSTLMHSYHHKETHIHIQTVIERSAMDLLLSAEINRWLKGCIHVTMTFILDLYVYLTHLSNFAALDSTTSP